MNKFFFSSIFTHFWRSFTLVLSSFLVLITIFLGVYIFQNSSSAISYYSATDTNPKKLTLSANTNILQVLNKDDAMSEKKIQTILQDENFENTKIFRLVTIPVSAKFWFFSFGLESDIPVFSVTDSALSGAKIPIGMSRLMLDVYNAQFAGSSAHFLPMNELFLIGQKIDFTFGKSKIFESSTQISKPFTGTITTINNDFPGIGLILPESLVRAELQKIWHSLGTPYKIITEVKNLEKKAEIEKKYTDLWINTRFEIDKITQTNKKISNIAMIIFSIWITIISIILLFFTFLLSSFFRERKNIFQLISLFGLNSKKSYFMTMSEPIFLTIIGLLCGIFAIFCIKIFFHAKISEFIQEKWFLFPLSFPNFWEIFIMCGASFFIIFLMIFGMEIVSRKKYTFQ